MPHATLNGHMAIVYKITSPENKIYVGVTKRKNINGRIAEHKVHMRTRTSSTVMYQDMNRLGFENFKFDIVENCSDDVCFEREKHWIIKLKSFEFGYNKSLGGQGPNGLRITEDRRNQVSKQSKSRWADKSFRKKIMAAKMPSLQDSEMQRKKGILGGKAKGLLRPLLSVYDNGIYIGDFRLGKDLAIHLGISESTACRYLNGKIGRKRFSFVRKVG